MVEELPSKVSTFMKVGSGAGTEYFNDKKIKMMNSGTSRTVMFFDVSKIDFAFVATAESAETTELYPYKLGFYRLTYKDIDHFFHLYHDNSIYTVVGIIISVVASFCICSFIIRSCKNAMSKTKPESR